jgi:hypothetical protein
MMKRKLTRCGEYAAKIKEHTHNGRKRQRRKTTRTARKLTEALEILQDSKKTIPTLLF